MPNESVYLSSAHLGEVLAPAPLLGEANVILVCGFGGLAAFLPYLHGLGFRYSVGLLQDVDVELLIPKNLPQSFLRHQIRPSARRIQL